LKAVAEMDQRFAEEFEWEWKVGFKNGAEKEVIQYDG